MPKYAVYAIATVSKLIAEVEAENEKEAIAKAYEVGDAHISVCHHCASSIDVGDVYEEQVEEIL